MLLVLAKQELIGHAGDVIANDDVTGFCVGRFFVRDGHGARSIEVKGKKLMEAAHGAVAVFGDGGMIVDVLEQEAFHFSVALRDCFVETGKPARGAANVVHGSCSGRKYALLRGID